MKTITVTEFQTALKEQNVPTEFFAFKCPMCGTVQCAHDFIVSGAGPDFQSVATYLGFSCVGRFTGAGSPRKQPDGNACNWTLGGFLQLHALEIVDEDGVTHPHFEIASPSEAQEHMRSFGGAV